MSGYVYRTTDELREIIYWSDQYSPRKIKEMGYFIMVSRVNVPQDNSFVKVTATTVEAGILPINDTLIGFIRRTSQSVMVMLYEESWEDRNFYDARASIRQQISDRESPPPPTRTGPCSVY
jgi:hypothetical protein